jgi:hypothetical protein
METTTGKGFLIRTILRAAGLWIMDTLVEGLEGESPLTSRRISKKCPLLYPPGDRKEACSGRVQKDLFTSTTGTLG